MSHNKNLQYTLFAILKCWCILLLRFLILLVFFDGIKNGQKIMIGCLTLFIIDRQLDATSSVLMSVDPTNCCFSIFIIFNSKMQPLFYFPCVCHHQEDGLRQIFMLTMEVLQEFSRRENLNAQMSSVFQRYLALANQVLSWNFLPPNYILSVTPGNVRMIGLTISWSRNMAPEKQV